MTGDPRAVLVAARKLIEKPENWNRGWLACNVRGENTEYDADDAVAWCALGAINAAASRNGRAAMDSERRAVFALNNQTGGYPIASWNDDIERTHDEILAAFDAAIASLGSPTPQPPSAQG